MTDDTPTADEPSQITTEPRAVQREERRVPIPAELLKEIGRAIKNEAYEFYGDLDEDDEVHAVSLDPEGAVVRVISYE